MSAGGNAVAFSLSLVAAVASGAQAGVTHYDVRLTVDMEGRLLHGKEVIRFEQGLGEVEWQKQAGLRILSSASSTVTLTSGDTSVHGAVQTAGTHKVEFQYTAAEARGLRLLPEKKGLFTAFYCEAWMICRNAPDQRATLLLEVTVKDAKLRAVGPGVLRKEWHDAAGGHWRFAVEKPAQTYLFSFAVAELSVSRQGKLSLYAATTGHAGALEKTADAIAFMRSKAGVEALPAGYAQAFLPPRGLAQEASGSALLSQAYLDDLEQKDSVVLMAHEIAHQWWGVLVGIRSWSDFWLNEGMAEFLSQVYLERKKGRGAYNEAIAGLEKRMDELRASGRDRPLHFEKWKDASEALGSVPYVKGALFLGRLRSELGEEKFWSGIALYTRRHAGQLVDSHDFQRAMEEAGGRSLGEAFQRDVFGN